MLANKQQQKLAHPADMERHSFRVMFSVQSQSSITLLLALFSLLQLWRETSGSGLLNAPLCQQASR